MSLGRRELRVLRDIERFGWPSLPDASVETEVGRRAAAALRVIEERRWDELADRTCLPLPLASRALTMLIGQGYLTLHLGVTERGRVALEGQEALSGDQRYYPQHTGPLR